MTWIKLSEELYTNTDSNFSLEKIDGIWYVIDNLRQQKSIPFTDIFNNPVFSFNDVDLLVKTLYSLGNITGQNLISLNSISGLAVRANHFRSELSSDPTTPGFSAQSDPDTGFYHISSGLFGYSSNGTERGRFGSDFGGFFGNIIQVKSSIKTDTSTFGNTYGAISGLSVAITPKSLNSKIVILASVNTGKNQDFCTNLKIQRNGIDIFQPVSPGSRIATHSSDSTGISSPAYIQATQIINLVDVPSTLSEIIYTTLGQITGSGSIGYINRSAADGNSNIYARSVSSIIAMEVYE